MFGIARLFSVIASLFLRRCEPKAWQPHEIAELGLLRLRLATASAPRNDMTSTLYLTI